MDKRADIFSGLIMKTEYERAELAILGIVVAFVLTLCALVVWGCERTPGDCRRTCAKLGMDVTFVPIAGDPHACDCKRWGE